MFCDQNIETALSAALATISVHTMTLKSAATMGGQGYAGIPVRMGAHFPNGCKVAQSGQVMRDSRLGGGDGTVAVNAADCVSATALGARH